MNNELLAQTPAALRVGAELTRQGSLEAGRHSGSSRGMEGGSTA